MKSSEDSVGPLGKNQRISVNAIANKTAPTPEMGYNVICYMGQSFAQRFFNEKFQVVHLVYTPALAKAPCAREKATQTNRANTQMNASINKPTPIPMEYKT